MAEPGQKRHRSLAGLVGIDFPRMDIENGWRVMYAARLLQQPSAQRVRQ